MKPEEVFGIVVRTIGLLMLIPASLSAAYGLLGLLMGGPAQTIVTLLFSVPTALVGLWMVRGANSLIEFAYPPPGRRMYSNSGRLAERRFGSQSE